MKHCKKVPRRGRLSVALALAGSLAHGGCAVDDDSPELASSDGIPEPPSGTTHVVGPTTVIDAQNDIAIDVPAGWYAIVPRLGRGSTTLASYDLRTPEADMPERGSHVLMQDMAKIDVIAMELGDAGSIDEWVERRRLDMSAGKSTAEGAVESGLAVSAAISYQLAERQGYAYTVNLGLVSAVEIALPWDRDRVLLATVLPADTIELGTALPILDRVRTVSDERLARSPAEQGKGELVAPIAELVAEAGAMTTKNACSTWTGSDSGSAAPNTPITLNLPFYWQTWWQAGGAGAFWGNLYHGNCYDDYYAIDFNRTSSSSCTSYLDDAGQNLYPVANGTAYVYWSSSGYGNRVDVYHSSGIMTRYAHMQSINVSSGQAVTTQTLIGWVGTTGNSSAPHLHFGYYKDGVSRCNAAGGRCPNGEASKSPQTPKPSPMNTNLGSKTISDGGCYQAPP